MWYFAWILGIGFAVLLVILNATWGENKEARRLAHDKNAANHAPRGAHGQACVGPGVVAAGAGYRVDAGPVRIPAPADRRRRARRLFSTPACLLAIVLMAVRLSGA
ncbi:MAG: cytochrome bd-I oxidase subunit CydX [Bacillota bacterium]